MRVNIKAVNKQRRFLGAVGISAILEHIVSKLTDGVKVFAAFIHVWDFGCKADGELAKK